MLVAAMAMVWLTTSRLDALAARAPGVWDSTQLLPFAQDAFFSLSAGQQQSPAGADLERGARDQMRSLLTPLSSDVAVASWPRAGDEAVVVGVAETPDPAAAAASLDGAAGLAGSIQTMRAWAEGERFVVVVGAAVVPPGDPEPVADLAADQVEASLRLARAAWFVAAAMGPVVALVVVVGIFVFAGWIVVAAALLVRLLVFLLVQLPLALLTAGRRGSTRPPRLPTRPAPRPPGLASHVDVLDIDQSTSTPAARLGRLGAAVLLLALALPALTPAWWPGSLVGGALVGAWLLLRALGGDRLLARALRWAVLAVAAAALADSLFAAGVVDPSGHPAVSVAIVAAAAVMLLVFLRPVLTGGRRLPYAPWVADLGPRSTAYLLAAIGLLVAGTGLFLGSNGDPDLRAHLENGARRPGPAGRPARHPALPRRSGRLPPRVGPRARHPRGPPPLVRRRRAHRAQPAA